MAAASGAASVRRAPTFARVLGTQVLRGSATLTAVAVTVALVYEVFLESPTWGGTWLGLGVALRSALTVAGPVVVAGATWAAGRERRRGMGDLLGSTARPPWQRVVLGWGSVTLGATVGTALVWAAAAVLVARVASYDGGRVLHPLVAAVSIGMLAAVGTVVGRFVPWRGAAPVAAIAALYVLAFMGSGQLSGGSMWLSPALPNWAGRDLNLPANGAVLESLWFGSLTGMLLVVAGARHRAWALAPALIAIVAAIPLTQGPGQDRWPLSDAATREVCSGDVPRVCVTQMSAFLLDDLKVRVDALWPRLDGVDGAPRVFREAPEHGYSADSRTTYVYSLASDLRGQLDWGPMQADELTANVVGVQCVEPSDNGGGRFRTNQDAVFASAGGLLSGRFTSRHGDPESEQVRRRLTSALSALPAAEQRAWLGRYLTAVRSTGPCDEAALDALLDVS